MCNLYRRKKVSIEDAKSRREAWIHVAWQAKAFLGQVDAFRVVKTFFESIAACSWGVFCQLEMSK